MGWEHARSKIGPRERRPGAVQSGQTHFITPDGEIINRRVIRNPAPRELASYDLDAMTKAQLREFVVSWSPREPLITWARRLFPLRPDHYPGAARTLYKMAFAKLAGRHKRYEQLYVTLPPFAQFRREFNIAACFSE